MSKRGRKVTYLAFHIFDTFYGNPFTTLVALSVHKFGFLFLARVDAWHDAESGWWREWPTSRSRDTCRSYEIGYLNLYD